MDQFIVQTLNSWLRSIGFWAAINSRDYLSLNLQPKYLLPDNNYLQPDFKVVYDNF